MLTLLHGHDVSTEERARMSVQTSWEMSDVEIQALEALPETVELWHGRDTEIWATSRSKAVEALGAVVRAGSDLEDIVLEHVVVARARVVALDLSRGRAQVGDGA